MRKVLVISEAYKKGGAGNATEEIFQFFKKENINFKLLIPFTKKKEDNIVSYYNNFTNIFYLIFKFLLRGVTLLVSKNKNYFFNNILNISFYRSSKIKKLLKEFKPDYVLILWYEYILNYETILDIKNKFNVNIIIYPFDMYSFTGGCRYTQACNNYNQNCQSCPAVHFKNMPNVTFLKNKKILKKINPIFLFPSQFSLDFAIKTKIINDKIKKLIFYYPISKKKIEVASSNDKIVDKIKKKISNNKYKNIIFFGSQNATEWRKGIYNLQYMIEIYKINYPYNFKNTLFICMGKHLDKIFFKEKAEDNFLIFNFLNFECYNYILNLSQIIIIPSLQEWSSLMLSEAFYKKKIIISFKTGSSYDYVNEYSNGFILNSNNASEFSHVLNNIFHGYKKIDNKKFEKKFQEKKEKIQLNNIKILNKLLIK